MPYDDGTIEELIEELNYVYSENEALILLLSDSDKSCLYCGRPAEDLGKCTGGPLHCKRFYDVMNFRSMTGNN